MTPDDYPLQTEDHLLRIIELVGISDDYDLYEETVMEYDIHELRGILATATGIMKQWSSVLDEMLEVPAGTLLQRIGIDAQLALTNPDR
jgi:hypothetical protein